MLRRNATLLAGLLVAAAAAAPRAATAQPSGVETWARNCGRCHVPQPANRYTAKDWESIVTHMMITARLTDSEADAVLEFLKGGAKRVAGAPEAALPRWPRSARLASLETVGPAVADGQPGGKEIFQRQCAPCHGVHGRGDGPVAAALNPKPANLADPDFQAQRSDDALVRTIREGKGAMPGFGGQFTDAEIRALVGYIRSLGPKKH